MKETRRNYAISKRESSKSIACIVFGCLLLQVVKFVVWNLTGRLMGPIDYICLVPSGIGGVALLAAARHAIRGKKNRIFVFVIHLAVIGFLSFGFIKFGVVYHYIVFVAGAFYGYIITAPPMFLPMLFPEYKETEA